MNGWMPDPENPQHYIGGKKGEGYLFRELDVAEVVEFKQYAILNDPEDMDKWFIYHPVCRAVWIKRGVGVVN